MRRYIVIFPIMVVLAAGIGGPVTAQEMTQEQQAAMMKAMTPGEHHQHIAQFEGRFEYTGKMWMAPGATPVESRGTSEAKMILGGRYLEDFVTGEYEGMPFEGRALTGYDNMKGEYESTWVDNFSTGILYAKGSCTNGGKTITLEGKSLTPMMEGEMPFREVLRIVDDKHHVLEWYGPAQDGEMFKMMELTYTRLD